MPVHLYTGFSCCSSGTVTDLMESSDSRSLTERKVPEVILLQSLIKVGPLFESVHIAQDYVEEIFAVVGASTLGRYLGAPGIPPWMCH